MRAFHSNWTAPFFARHPANTPYAVEPFELFTTMLSALTWRKAGHSIRMITDAIGAAYYRALGLELLWDDGIYDTLTDIPATISPHIYWAAGKLFALRQMSAPCVMLDTDFIVWRDIAPLCQNCDVAVIHQEDILPEIYPDAAHFRTDTDLSALDWTVRPCNTALTCFFDAALLADYTEHALQFMLHTPMADNTLTYMVFAEQRMLSMRIAAKQSRLTVFSDLPALFGTKQNYFTHIWGHKQQLRNNTAANEAFCRRCAVRLSKDFPFYAQIAAAIPSLQVYF